MPSSFFSSDSSRPSSGTAPAPLAPAAQWQTYRQHQQQPNQGPAGATAPPAADLALLDEDDDEASSLDGGSADDNSFDAAPPQDSGTGNGDHDDPPAAGTSSADPLRAERRRSNQLEKELRKARAQLSRPALALLGDQPGRVRPPAGRRTQARGVRTPGGRAGAPAQ
ncbi:MAG: hypothetical protein ACKOPS_14430 [Cyanobium sp.]